MRETQNTRQSQLRRKEGQKEDEQHNLPYMKGNDDYSEHWQEKMMFIGEWE